MSEWNEKAAAERAAFYEAEDRREAIAEAVAAERRRAAEAVREIVERRHNRYCGARAAGLEAVAEREWIASEIARECLAAVEGGAVPDNMARLEDAVRAYLMAGLRVNAVKLYRMRTGAPLKEALARVDEIAAGGLAAVEGKR